MPKISFLQLLLTVALAAVPVTAQFAVKIPHSAKSNPIEAEAGLIAANNLPGSLDGQNRTHVMDDGYTFFDAEPVKEYDKTISLQKDIGWYLRARLRILGTFPTRSAFRVVVKKNGQKLAETRCEGSIYTKAGDLSLGSEMRRKERDLNYEDFMYTNTDCKKDTAVIKQVGNLDVEVYFVDGDTTESKLVRNYKIDVHRAPRVRGSASKPQPDVAHYYISRHAESAVGFVMVSMGASNYFKKPVDTYSSPQYSTLVLYSSYSPGRNGRLPNNTYARCSVNGAPLKLEWDKVSVTSETQPQEYAVYTDRLTAQYKRGSAYRDDIIFRRVRFVLPLYSGETKYSKPRMKIESTPGNWECKILSNGELYRTFRWKVGSDGKIARHAEQLSGNVNLFHNTALVDMEIPDGGTEWDHRLVPVPNEGLFYGIPWTSVEGKAMAARMPKKGNPFHVPSNKVK